MKNALKLVQADHESSSFQTKQYIETYQKFLKDFNKLLKTHNVDEFDFFKPNHFDIGGFFRLGEQWIYFKINDLRWSKDEMLIRTAKSNKDYVGGQNNFISLASEQEFTEQLAKFINKHKVEAL